MIPEESTLYLLIGWLVQQGVHVGFAPILAQLIFALGAVALAYVLTLIVRRILVSQLRRFFKRTSNQYDDYILKHNLLRVAASIIPGLVFYFVAPLFPAMTVWIQRLAFTYIVLVVALVLSALLDILYDIYNTTEGSDERPITGYIQIIKIIIFIFAAILVISILIDQSPWVLLGGLSALTAVILLVFQDTILGLVASIQLTYNKMLAIGDWIEMPNYNADGELLEVTVNTAKVQNWDKTITTIPTYKLIADSFRNWRGMEESGGRRIKRSIYIDMHSVRFCDQAMLERFEGMRYLKDYILQKRKEIGLHNQSLGIDADDIINGRWLTNIGSYRAYMLNYLQGHPQVSQDMTLLVRHLQPTENGLPIEVYFFCTDQRWAHYESIQADIFDHFLAILPEFDLRVYQSESDINAQYMIDFYSRKDRDVK